LETKSPSKIPFWSSLDILSLSVPSDVESSYPLQERDVGGEETNRRKLTLFRLRYRLLQHASEAIALVFVADMSSFDSAIDPSQGLTRLHEALFLFRNVWQHCLAQQKPVLLFLNKCDEFEAKVRASGPQGMRAHFPRLEGYEPMCSAAKKEVAAGGDAEIVKAKYFVRDSFLQIAQQLSRAARQGTSSTSGPSSSSSHGNGHNQCYPYFVTMTDTEAVGRLINDSCRDILQRVHLRMHEIL